MNEIWAIEIHSRFSPNTRQIFDNSRDSSATCCLLQLQISVSKRSKPPGVFFFFQFCSALLCGCSHSDIININKTQSGDLSHERLPYLHENCDSPLAVWHNKSTRLITHSEAGWDGKQTHGVYLCRWSKVDGFILHVCKLWNTFLVKGDSPSLDPQNSTRCPRYCNEKIERNFNAVDRNSEIKRKSLETKLYHQFLIISSKHQIYHRYFFIFWFPETWTFLKGFGM